MEMLVGEQEQDSVALLLDPAGRKRPVPSLLGDVRGMAGQASGSWCELTRWPLTGRVGIRRAGPVGEDQL